MKRIFTFIAILLLLGAHQAFSHPGGLDSQGGHTDKRTGEYHFHKKAEKAVSPAPYNRDEWSHWTDADQDCQNTRAEILIRDNKGLIKFKRNRGCIVTWGRWICPYTGHEYTKASDMGIDHIVPLAHAHKTGGAGWTKEKKRGFANDPDNLLAVEDDINREKSDQAPDKWKPPLKSYWPEYAKKWRAVKKKYHLYISPAEEKALKEMVRQ